MRLASLEPGSKCPDLGHVPLREQSGDEALDVDESIAADSSEQTASPFWSGSALGKLDLEAVLWGIDPRLILVAGSENAGKTSLLVAMWVEIANGHAAAFDRHFAGSRSLRGWTQLSNHAFAWKEGHGQIVPRTSIADVRQPSFLHFNLAKGWHETLTQVVLSDLPGEWFENWMMRRDAGLAHIPMLPRVDGVLLVIDAPRVLDDPQYMHDCTLLRDRIREVSSTVRRPIALVLTKADAAGVDVGGYDEQRIRAMPTKFGNRVKTLLEAFDSTDSVRVFATSVLAAGKLSPSEALAPLLWLLSETEARTVPTGPTISRRPDAHPFHWLRELP